MIWGLSEYVFPSVTNLSTSPIKASNPGILCSTLAVTSCASSDLSENPDPKTEFGLNFAKEGSRKATGKAAEKAERQVPIEPL